MKQPSKFLTPELKKAAEELAALEIIDERMERLKAIWPIVKEKLDGGITHAAIYKVIGPAVAGGTALKLATFSKMLTELYSRGKKKKSLAARASEAEAREKAEKDSAARRAKRSMKNSSPSPSPVADGGVGNVGSPFADV